MPVVNHHKVDKYVEIVYPGIRLRLAALLDLVSSWYLSVFGSISVTYFIIGDVYT